MLLVPVSYMSLDSEVDTFDLTTLRIPLVSKRGASRNGGYSNATKPCIHGPVAELPTTINLDILGVPGNGMFLGGISFLPCVACFSNNL